MDNKNQRRHERIKLPYVIKFRTPENKSFESWDAVNPINMSESGICFFTVFGFATGIPMQLLVTNPIQMEERVYDCKVLRSERSPTRPMFYETVVVIENVADDAKEIYSKLLKAFKDEADKENQPE